jgi:transposase
MKYRITHCRQRGAKKTYAAASISDDAKTMIARLYQVQHAQGKLRHEFVADMSQAGYRFSESQLDRWVAHINAGESAVSTSKATGASAHLTHEQRDISGGWLLSQNLRGAPVHLSDYSNFCDEQFGQSLSKPTVSRYLEEDGFSYRTMHGSAKGYTVDILSQRYQLWDWVQTQRQEGIFDIHRSLLASIDFTFTGHRTERSSSFASQGGSQPILGASISPYTNCIITVVWADGINRTPPMFFTYNPEFRQDRNPTTRRIALVQHFDDCLKESSIDIKRIVYVGKEKGESRLYVSESPALLRIFFERYKVPKCAVILSDVGNSFVDQGKSVLLDFGFQKHIFYPAAVHQYLSPNDNRLHGTAKKAWRESNINYKDDVKSCIFLLHRLDKDIQTQSKMWFDRNMIELKESDVEGLIGSAGRKFSKLHKSWLRVYLAWMGLGDHSPNLDD